MSKIRDTIMHEIADIAEERPDRGRDGKVKNQLVNDAVRMRQSSMSRAQQIAEFAFMTATLDWSIPNLTSYSR